MLIAPFGIPMPSLTMPSLTTSLCYHCDSPVHYDITMVYPNKCSNCTNLTYYAPPYLSGGHILSCMVCRRLFSRSPSSYMLSIGVNYCINPPNCPRCDPSTDKVKYVHRLKDGWILSSFRVECVNCH